MHFFTVFSLTEQLYVLVIGYGRAQHERIRVIHDILACKHSQT